MNSATFLLSFCAWLSPLALGFTDAEVRRQFSLRTEQAEAAAMEVIRQKRTTLYNDVWDWYRTSRSSYSPHERVTQGIVDAVGKDKAWQQLMLENNRGLVSRDPKTSVNQLRLSPTDAATLRIASALRDAGALQSVPEVRYTIGNTPVDFTVSTGNAELAPERLANWILDNHHTGLYPAVLQIRDESTRGTKPPRAELTQAILNRMSEGNPEDVSAMRRAALGHFVGIKEDGYTPDFRKIKETKLAKYKTLSIDAQDDGDLRIARELDRHAMLEGVQMIRWDNLPDTIEERVKDQFVYDRDGLRLSEMLQPENFTRDSRTGQVGRSKFLQDEGRLIRAPYLYTPKEEACQAYAELAKKAAGALTPR